MAEGMPTLMETALGAFLHDAGKFWQRAHGSQKNASAQVREIAEQALPRRDGRLTHVHALWTWEFFHWMESEHLAMPGVRMERVRNIAGYHHRPGGGPPEEAVAQHLVTEADRLAAGMDREARREEDPEESGRWDAFIRTPLRSPFSAVLLDERLGKAGQRVIPLGILSPESDIAAQERVETDGYQARYQQMVGRFQEEMRRICRLKKPWLFQSALKSLCERHWSTVPSSTMDHPDVSLYDHSRAVAAIAAALYQWHAFHEGMSKEALEGTRRERKFRWILGDLSGIQAALFRLQHQQVRGVARILRARSFLMGLVTESAALDLLWRMGLTPFSLLQNAGGRFLILAADTDATREAFEGARRDVEQWMLERWRGELALHVSMTEPFEAALFERAGFGQMTALWSKAAEEAKQRPFSTCYEAVMRQDRFEHGACGACGVRPARAGEGEDAYCGPCSEERALGGDLPRLRVVGWSRGRVGEERKNIRLWNGLWLHWHYGGVRVEELEEGFLAGGAPQEDAPLAVRFLPHHVPVLAADEVRKPAYERHLSAEARESKAGDGKTFEHLALDALEERDGKLYGEDLLAVVKADVDRLGAVFSQGVQRPSLGLVAGLSRMLDFFFSARLPHLLRADERFQSTYVVYAGGDDLLLAGPWRQSAELVGVLREEFARFVGNPQITLSAALELTHPDEPLNRSVREAEERLERAKQAGRNRVCAIQGEPMKWEDYGRQLERAEELVRWIRAGSLSTGFVYRMLEFDRDRMQCERGEADAHAASWRARWGYQLRRNLGDLSSKQELVRLLNALMGLDGQLRPGARAPSARTAVTVALYRTRAY